MNTQGPGEGTDEMLFRNPSYMGYTTNNVALCEQKRSTAVLRPASLPTIHVHTQITSQKKERAREYFFAMRSSTIPFPVWLPFFERTRVRGLDQCRSNLKISAGARHGRADRMYRIQV